MKQECPTYLKTIGKSKALAATLSDTKLEDDSDNEDDGISNVFTATVDPIDGGLETVDDKKDLVDSKFEKMDDQDDIHIAYEKLYQVSKKHEKLYKLATKKLSDVELDREELSTKFDETNQTIEVLWFENNFLAEKTKKLETELFQVRAQLERTSNAKLDEMLSLQKFTSDSTGLGYNFSSSSIASTSTIVFVSLLLMLNLRTIMSKIALANQNIDKGKSILGAPLKLDKKETKNSRAKKGNTQKSKWLAIGHT